MNLRNVVIATDFSPMAQSAFGLGLAVARAAGARLTICHAVPLAVAIYAGVPIGLRPELEATLRAKEARDRRRAGRLVRRAEEEGLKATAVIEEGDAANVVLAGARRTKADLIVAGSHGRGGAAHLLLGSVAERIVRNAPCPVLIVKKGKLREKGPVLAALDDSPMAPAVAKTAAEVARGLGVKLTAVHVIRETHIYEDVYGPAIGRQVYREIADLGMKRAKEKVAAVLRKAGAEVAGRDLHVREGRAQDVVTDLVNRVRPCLVVVGTHGRHGLKRIVLGSVAEAIVRQSAAPVLVARMK